ncbi:MAG TPA: hypothetical protein VFB63_02375, partial [Bryobacteraceae bacterium]|nr:hypothetical protein [Bryobacteraceae bacterium]
MNRRPSALAAQRTVGEGAYKFDPGRSEITQAGIDTSLAIDIDIAPGQLLAFARTSLLRLARSAIGRQIRTPTCPRLPAKQM